MVLQLLLGGTLGNDSGQKDYWDLAEFSGISEHDWRWGKQENWQSSAPCTMGLSPWMPALEKFAPLLPFSKIIIVLEQIFE